MNYYPNNFYQNYSYGNSYQAPQPQQNISALQGKIVDSIDMVRANEVPFGGFGVFPKGDLSEIYVKSWNNNGTTQINTYKPIPVDENVNINNNTFSNDELLNKITALNEKLDYLINGSTATPQKVKEKEVKTNAF